MHLARNIHWHLPKRIGLHTRSHTPRPSLIIAKSPLTTCDVLVTSTRLIDTITSIISRIRLETSRTRQLNHSPAMLSGLIEVVQEPRAFGNYLRQPTTSATPLWVAVAGSQLPKLLRNNVYDYASPPQRSTWNRGEPIAQPRRGIYSTRQPVEVGIRSTRSRTCMNHSRRELTDFGHARHATPMSYA